MLPSWVIRDMVNIHQEEYGFPSITLSWVKKWRSNNHTKNLASFTRYGKKKFDDFIQPYLVRKKPTSPDNQWMVDGTPVNFYCIHPETGKIIRPYLFFVFDVLTRKIVGHSLGFTEDRHLIIKALKIAIKNCGRVACEILSDNASPLKTDEFKAIKENLGRIGCVINAHKAGNAQAKGNVERVIKTLQSRVFKLWEDSLGDGYGSKDSNGTPDKFALEKVRKKNGTPLFVDMERQVLNMINMYNNMPINGRGTPNKLYNELPKLKAKVVSPEGLAMIFWTEKIIKIRRAEIKFNIRKTAYHYRLRGNDLILKFHNKQVRVRYDELDLSSIMIFDIQTDELIAEVKQTIETFGNLADQTEDDTKRIIKTASVKKSLALHVKKEVAGRIDSAMEVVNKTKADFEVLNIPKTYKEKWNSEEDEHYNNMYLDETPRLKGKASFEIPEPVHTYDFAESMVDILSNKKADPATLETYDGDDD